MNTMLAMTLPRRNLLALAALWPLTARARAVRSTTASDAGDEATVRGDAGQTGRMPGPGPTGVPGLLWAVPDLHGRGLPPVAAGDLVFGMTEEPEAAVVALEAATGAERWRVERGRLLTLPAAPSYADGSLYVGAREQDGERRPLLLAIEAATGQERWRVPLTAAERHDEWLIPLAAGGVVYAAATDGHAYALDAATGEQRWRVAVGNASFPQPALADGLLVLLHEEGMLALDAATGQERWRGGPAGSMSHALDGGQVYAVGGGATAFEGGTLHALDAATGVERWSFAGASGIALGELAVAGDTVYVAGLLEFSALDAETGEIRWQVEGVIGYRSPAVVGDVLYVPYGSDFYAHDAATGAETWAARDWGEPIDGAAAISGPTVVGGRIFLYADYGLVALGNASDDASIPVG
jgi:outer membrane protein assembly factor BamB